MAMCAACESVLPVGARFCPACGAAVSGPAGGGEERKLATVLFADLVSSTAYAHGEDPERVRLRLDRFYEAMAEEIERTGGTVEKFAGDAVMAAFGAPAALEDHAERALHAALAMQRRLAELFGNELAIRIGVNTGEVVVGRPREGSSFITGDAVNVAARIEQAAAGGEVLAGERTIAAAGGAFEFGELRAVEAKGKPDAVACRPVLQALRLTRPRGVGALRRVFLGRESELDVLGATYRRAAAQGEPHLATIVGEPGVGKSRLVSELSQRLAGDTPAPLVRSGRCLPYGDGITYWPLGEVVKEHLGLRESDPPAEVRRRLGEHEMLGLALGLDLAGDLHPLEARGRLHEAAVHFVEGLAAPQPLVVVVEDIHWAEDDLLDLLERIARDARGPLLLLTTARPELIDRRPGWGSGRRNATSIWLEPLGEDVMARMLDELLAVEFPPELRDVVLERAEGNPFFVEELVGELLDAGVLERRDGGWAIGRSEPGFHVPDTVHAVLSARIDRLPVTEKAALQAAAVVGRVFWAQPVVGLLGGTEPDFELLEERDFVRRAPVSSLAGDHEYVIKHALTREVAYSSIPKARRGRLHATFAQWLERSDRAKDEHAALLAYHYFQAVRPEDTDLVWADAGDDLRSVRQRAVTWLRRAGELARGRYEMDEAVELFTRASQLVDDHERALLLREVGHAHALRYDGDAMRETLLRSLEGPLDDLERAETYAFLAFQASIRSAMWSIRLNRRLIEEWVERALALAPERSEAHIRALVARANVEPAEMSATELDRVGRLADELGSPQLRSHVLGARTGAAFARQHFAEAAAWNERRLDLLSENDDPDQLCEAYESAVPVVLAVGNVSEARRLAGLHRELAQRLSAHHRVHAVSLPLEIEDALGEWESLAARADETVDAVERNMTTPCVRNPRGLLLLAAGHLAIGDDARAVELERDAGRIAGQGYDTYLAGPRVRIALARGDRDVAEELALLPVERAFVWGPGAFASRLDLLVALRRADAIEQEASTLLEPGTLLEPFALRALGAARRDDDLLARADALFARLGLGWHRAQTERLLAGLP